MRGAVAAGHKETANAAAEVLRAGGNAFDAVVAGFFAACVCEAVLASLGGGGFLLARDSHGVARVFDFFTHTPRQKSSEAPSDFYPVMVDFGSAQQEFHVGRGSCAIPGAVSGMFEIHRALGRMSMGDLVQPAAELARNGVLVNPFQAYLLRLLTPIYSTSSALPVFCSPEDPGQLIGADETFTNSELSSVMELLAIEGESLFYRGEIGRSLAEVFGNGGCLRYQDLERYMTVVRHPLTVDYKNYRFLTNPPPSAGGVLIGFGLNLLNGVEMRAEEFGSYFHLRSLADILKSTTSARARHFGRGPHAELLDQPLIDQYRAGVLDAARAYRGTTHISVVDSHGNLAAMTVSNGEGCGELIPETGIMMNNMLGEEDLNPAGFHTWETDKRMSSMMAPSLLIDPGGGVTALGSGGSNRIRTALLQVISNLVDFQLDLEEAIRVPRIHIETSVLNAENDFPPGTIEGLLEEFPEHRLFEERSMFFGGVHAVYSGPNGIIRAVGDPRRNGVGLTIS